MEFSNFNKFRLLQKLSSNSLNVNFTYIYFIGAIRTHFLDLYRNTVVNFECSSFGKFSSCKRCVELVQILFSPTFYFIVANRTPFLDFNILLYSSLKLHLLLMPYFYMHLDNGYIFKLSGLPSVIWLFADFSHSKLQTVRNRSQHLKKQNRWYQNDLFIYAFFLCVFFFF